MMTSIRFTEHNRSPKRSESGLDLKTMWMLHCRFFVGGREGVGWGRVEKTSDAYVCVF